ncbi:hypothetical protein H0H87_005080 [Tephrocybe sp. NHM501043]|nr:hypothetical protein H0H87_005080 [Tephrocybe sp. NHM501043]
MPPRSLGSAHSYPPNPAASMIQRQQSLQTQRLGQHSHQHHYDEQRQLHTTPDRHQTHSSQTKRPRLGIDSSNSSSLGVYSNSQFRVPGHPASVSQGSSHGHSGSMHGQQHSPYHDYPQFSASSSSSQHFSSLGVPSRDRASSVSDRGVGGTPATPRTIYGSMSSGGRGDIRGPDTFNFLGGVEDARRRSGTASSGGSAPGIDWPASKPSSSANPSEHDQRDVDHDRTVEHPPSGPSSSGVNSTTGTDWLNFLSGTGSAPSNGPAVSSASRPGGMNWERGTSARTSGGGGGGPGGAGAIDNMALYGLSPNETKKEGG